MKVFKSSEEASDICTNFVPLVIHGPRGNNAYDWCKDYKSVGRFYSLTTGWHFELKNDALVFTLTWG